MMSQNILISMATQISLWQCCNALCVVTHSSHNHHYNFLLGIALSDHFYGPSISVTRGWIAMKSGSDIHDFRMIHLKKQKHW